MGGVANLNFIGIRKLKIVENLDVRQQQVGCGDRDLKQNTKATRTSPNGAPSSCRRHRLRHNRTPPHEPIVFIVFHVLLSFCSLLFYINCVFYTKLLTHPSSSSSPLYKRKVPRVESGPRASVSQIRLYV